MTDSLGVGLRVQKEEINCSVGNNRGTACVAVLVLLVCVCLCMCVLKGGRATRVQEV